MDLSKLVPPAQSDIKVEWTWAHKAVLVAATLIIWPCAIYFNYQQINTWKLIAVGGLYIDILGVVIASLKTPYYGAFIDGGQIQFWRDDVEKKSFQKGMLLIGVGFLLQALATVH
ncbi:MAG TPA: hypothetical protein VF682_13935 [Pseudomonas sp.]|jgi:hypothetical protein